MEAMRASRRRFSSLSRMNSRLARSSAVMAATLSASACRRPASTCSRTYPVRMLTWGLHVISAQPGACALLCDEKLPPVCTALEMELHPHMWSACVALHCHAVREPHCLCADCRSGA